jgi:hypothetical protein
MPAGQAKSPFTIPAHQVIAAFNTGFDEPARNDEILAVRLLSGTHLTCETYLALSQAGRQNALALKYYGLRMHIGERPFNSFRIAMDALNPSEQRQALADVAWLNQHCVGIEARRIAQAIRATTVAPGVTGFTNQFLSPPVISADAAANQRAMQPPPGAGQKPAGIVFGPSPMPLPYYTAPYAYSYPSELLSDCGRWGTLSRGEKFALVSRSMPAWRVPFVVAELDRACGSPYTYSVFPYAYAYPWAFSNFYSSWWRDTNFKNPPVISADAATNLRATQPPPGAGAHGEKPAGVIFGPSLMPYYSPPYAYPYPSGLLSDCGRWVSLSRDEKFALASQSVEPWRVASVVAELDQSCGSPFTYSVFPYAYHYPWAFPTYSAWYPTWWQRNNFQNPPVISADAATNVRATQPPPGAGAHGERPAGQVTLIPYSTMHPYPSQMLSDCDRWRTLSYGQKLALAGQSASAVAELDAACGSPYHNSLFPFAQAYPWAFPTYTTWWSNSFRFQNPPVISADAATNARATQPPPGAGAHGERPAGQGSVGQGFIGASLGIGTVGQGYIGRQLFPLQPYTFGATPYPWDAASLEHLPPRNALLPYYWSPASPKFFGDYYAPAGQADQYGFSQEELAGADEISRALQTGDQAAIDAAIRDQPPGNRPNPATPWLNLAGQTINASAGVIIAAINGQNQAERDRLTNATRLQIARLAAARPVSALDQQQQAATLAALAQLQQQLIQPPPPPVDHTTLYVGGAVAAAALVGVAVIATRGGRSGGSSGGRRGTDARANPVIGGRDNKHGHWVQPRKSRKRARARA